MRCDIVIKTHSHQYLSLSKSLIKKVSDLSEVTSVVCLFVHIIGKVFLGYNYSLNALKYHVIIGLTRGRR